MGERRRIERVCVCATARARARGRSGGKKSALSQEKRCFFGPSMEIEITDRRSRTLFQGPAGARRGRALAMGANAPSLLRVRSARAGDA